VKQKLLLVDDDHEPFLPSLPHSLSSETYEVTLAENVQQAIAKFDAGEIDLLLMNLDSPTGQGWEAIDAITGENPFLPIIVISSQAELRNLAEAAGACALVQKPVDVPMLLQTIGELLAEPFPRRAERVCNRTSDFRNVPASSGEVRDLLHLRYTAPLPRLPTRWGINE
jgi:DNA-binding NtrC family response regulator